jgi:formylmethanofuran dehydrogenase subunit E
MSENNEEQIKKEREREKRALWRYSGDGTYNNKPISETYFRDYYREKIACKVACDLCGRIVGKQKLDLHQKTKICAKYATLKTSCDQSATSESENC